MKSTLNYSKLWDIIKSDNLFLIESINIEKKVTQDDRSITIYRISSIREKVKVY